MLCPTFNGRFVPNSAKRFVNARECGRFCCYSPSQNRAAALIFRTGPAERVDCANLIAGCSGYFDRLSLA